MCIRDSPGEVLGSTNSSNPDIGGGGSNDNPNDTNSDPSSGVSDYTCTATQSGNNVELSLSGVRAGGENLLINGVWRASLTGQTRYTVTNVDTSATIEIRLRGNGYDGPGGFAVATCERAPAGNTPPYVTRAVVRNISSTEIELTIDLTIEGRARVFYGEGGLSLIHI